MIKVRRYSCNLQDMQEHARYNTDVIRPVIVNYYTRHHTVTQVITQEGKSLRYTCLDDIAIHNICELITETLSAQNGVFCYLSCGYMSEQIEYITQNMNSLIKYWYKTQ